MQFTQKQIGHFFIFVVITIFSVNIIVSKYLVTGHIYPFGLSVARLSFGCIAFWITSLFVKKEKIVLKDHLTLLLGGLSGFVCNQALFTFGLKMTSPIDASIITTSAPIFTLIIAAILLKEPITKLKVGGIIIGVIGASILVLGGEQTTSGESNLMGDLIVVGSAFSYAFYLVITKPIASKYSPVTIMKWMFLYACIIFVPFNFHYLLHAPLFHETDHTALYLLAYPLVCATYLAYMMIVMAQRRIRATTISMYSNLQPVIASAIAICFLGEILTVQTFLAASLVFLGVYLVTKSKARKDVEIPKK